MSKKEKQKSVPLAKIDLVKKEFPLNQLTPEQRKAAIVQKQNALEKQNEVVPNLEHDIRMEENIDPGIGILAVLAQALKNPIISEKIYDLRQEKRGQIKPNEFPELIQRYFSLKSQRIKIKIKEFSAIQNPLILIFRSNRYKLLIRSDSNQLMLVDPITNKQEVFSEGMIGSKYLGKAISIQMNPAGKTELSPEVDSRFGFSWLLKHILRFKSVFIQILIAALLIQVFALVTPLFTMVIIDKVFSSSGFSTLNVLIFGLFAISIFDYLISSSRQILLNSVTHKVDFMLSSAFFKKLTSLPLSFFSTKQVGDAVSRVKELEVIRNFFTGNAFMLLIDFPFLIIFLAVMFMFSVKLTITAAIFIFLVLATYGIFAPLIRSRLKNKNKIQTDNSSFLIETITGIEAIKSMSLEANAQQRWNKLIIDQAKNSANTERLTGHISQFSGFLTKSTSAVCLWLGALLVLDGEMTPGQLIAFNMIVGRVIAPTQRISQLLQQINQLKISFQRVGEVMNTKSELQVQQTYELPKLEGRIRLDKVSFKYNEDGNEVLKNISFDIKPKEIIGLIGSTGSGKTTLLRILQRLHLPSDGHVYIDNMNVLGINPVWFREKIGVVSQENILFNLSVSQNIRLAFHNSNSIDIDKIVEVCKIVGADRWIRQLPHAYDTIVGERGRYLSGGQRQQLSIARALIRDPKILLLDEATSSLDYESEGIVQKNMKLICEGRTVIIVAHRLPTLEIVDKIVKLEGGELIEINEADSVYNKGNPSTERN